MCSLFYKLGRAVAPGVRKTKWLWKTATGSEGDAIKAEQQVGQDMAYALKEKMRLDVDSQTRHLINEVGSKLADCTANKQRRFTFMPFKGPQAQAFSLPGGFIFISQRLIQLCEWNKNELAFILAHEMAHVISGHVMERMISNSAIAVALRSRAAGSAVANLLGKAGNKLLQSAYSQDQELEADKLGIELTSAAGYEPHGSIRLLQRLAKLDESGNESKLSDYFCSHPSLKARIAFITQLLSQ